MEYDYSKKFKHFILYHLKDNFCICRSQDKKITKLKNILEYLKQDKIFLVDNLS
jgi:hypothetical protein